MTKKIKNIGIDINKRKCVVCVMDDKGKILEETAYDNTLADARVCRQDEKKVRQEACDCHNSCCKQDDANYLGHADYQGTVQVTQCTKI